MYVHVCMYMYVCMTVGDSIIKDLRILYLAPLITLLSCNHMISLSVFLCGSHASPQLCLKHD